MKYIQKRMNHLCFRRLEMFFQVLEAIGALFFGLGGSFCAHWHPKGPPGACLIDFGAILAPMLGAILAPKSKLLEVVYPVDLWSTV